MNKRLCQRSPGLRRATLRRPLTLLDVGVRVGGGREGANRKDAAGATPLMRAALGGTVPLVRALLARGARVGERDLCGGNTALMYACEGGARLALVRTLIAHGADVNAVNDWHSFPLLKAIGRWLPLTRDEWRWVNHPHGPALVRLLLDKGAHVDQRTEFGNTALTTAAAHGALRVMAVLLARGADVDAQNRNGYTALHVAVGRNDTSMVTLLLAAGADTSLRLRIGGGRTPLGAARRRGRSHVAVAGLLESAGARE